MTGVPVKEVHRIVDAGLLEGVVGRRAGKRMIVSRGLVGLKLVHETAELLTPEGRRQLVKGLLRQGAKARLRDAALTIDVRPTKTAIRRGLDALERARKMVVVDKDVLGGTPCVKGTRIPVHDIAAMVANGDRKSAILRAYPKLAAAQIDLAVLYALAYPQRGRPRRKPLWRKAGPISSEKLPLGDLPAAS